MKKVLALVVVVFVLAVAGSAFAVSHQVARDAKPIDIKAPSSQTVSNINANLGASTGETYSAIDDDAIGERWDKPVYPAQPEGETVEPIATLPVLTLDTGSYLIEIEVSGLGLSNVSSNSEFRLAFATSATATPSIAESAYFVDANGNSVSPSNPGTVLYIAFKVSGGKIAAEQEFYPSICIATPDSDVYTGGGSGGCSAGFGALTLAVLGGLFALRRKQ